MMIINLLLATTSAISLVFYPCFASKCPALIWVIVAINGLGIASIFPTTLSWVEQYIDINERYDGSSAF